MALDTSEAAPEGSTTASSRQLADLKARLRNLAAARPGERSEVNHTTTSGGPLDAARHAVARLWSIVTPLGRATAVIAVVAWLIGWQLGWYEFMIIAGCFAVALALSVPFTLGRALLDVSLQVTPGRVFVGERAAGLLAARNAARTRLLPSRLELTVGRGIARFDLPSLATDETHEEVFVIPTRRRGVIPVGPVSTVRGDPLGLLRRVVPWSSQEELIVHPRVARLDSLGTGFLRDLEGQTTNHLSSADVAFHTLRDYVPGDDRRLVHWKTTARTGRLMVRQFVDTRRSHAAVVVDLDPASYIEPDPMADPDAPNEELELAVAVAASLAVRVIRDEQTLTLITAEGRQPSMTGQQALDSCARMELTADGGLPRTAAVLANDAADASIVFLITGSRSTLGDMRRALVRTSQDATVLAIRARADATGGFRQAAGLTLGEVGTVDQLARLLRAVVR